nr:putative DEAD-box ATP-dependent RNA helicase 29 isoform X2 [Anas platyrhynchos]|eukprot:XP_027303624.1 putative DEAD-box ATP-dependent RNA helicase 29 isoform X6 [Anas platyrhynchos]
MSRGGRGGGGRGGRTNDILSGRGERDISNGVGGRDIPSSGDGHTLSNTGKEQDKFSGDDYDEHDKFNGGGRHGNHGGGPVLFPVPLEGSERVAVWCLVAYNG